MNKLIINKVAVLGAGVMGSQIAAHFANCGYQVLLFDLPNRAAAAMSVLTKLKPSPLATSNALNNITCCNYDNDLSDLAECDWIIEAVAEDMKIKADLYTKIMPSVNSTAIFTTNTSGISLNNLAEILTGSNAHDLQQRFCGMHFFNPPRYQKLLELIPHSKTNPALLDRIEEHATSYLGKGVVRAKDTPNFIANRIGVFSMLATMHHAKKYNLGFDVVDVLTGVLIGRPKSGTFRTADVVGLDTLVSVINTMKDNCPNDPWHHVLASPDYLLKLVSNKCLGQKTQKGFYFKDKKAIKVLDLKTMDYVDTDPDKSGVDEKLLTILKLKSPAEKFKQLKDYQHPQAQFLWECFRDVWHYASYHLRSIADNVRDIDLALKWGFGWQHGPFELWQAVGWQNVEEMITGDIQANKALSNAELPEWVAKIKYPYNAKNEAYNPSIDSFQPKSNLTVYNRQTESLLSADNQANIKTIVQNNSAKLWSYHQGSNKNLIFSFKTKMNVINTEILELLNQTIDYIHGSDEYNSLVIWQDKGEHFSAGADLNGFVACMQARDYKTMDGILEKFQTTCQRLRYSTFPVVAAVKGLAIGGGCELMLHADHVVATTESYIGLVETGVGVVPAGGGCKEMVLRANQYYELLINQKLATSADKLLETYYKNIAMAETSTSAQDALSKGYLRNIDTIIANPEELLFTALEVANCSFNANYRPPVKREIRVSGKRIKANIYALLANLKKGNFISEHDYLIVQNLANIISGGDLTADESVSEEWLLSLEREAFISLLKTEQTQARISHMLETGKPLRN